MVSLFNFIFALEHTFMDQPQIHIISLQIVFGCMKLYITINFSPIEKNCGKGKGTSVWFLVGWKFFVQKENTLNRMRRKGLSGVQSCKLITFVTSLNRVWTVVFQFFTVKWSLWKHFKNRNSLSKSEMIFVISLVLVEKYSC